jgi:hypothetical protein
MLIEGFGEGSVGVDPAVIMLVAILFVMMFGFGA